MSELSEERLAEIQAAIDRRRKRRYWTIDHWRNEVGSEWPQAMADSVIAADFAVDDLFAEVDRLRAENERLRDALNHIALDDPYGPRHASGIQPPGVIARAALDLQSAPEWDDTTDPTGEKRYPEMGPCR